MSVETLEIAAQYVVLILYLLGIIAPCCVLSFYVGKYLGNYHGKD